MKKILVLVFGLFLTLMPLNAAACGVGSTTKNGESLDCVETTVEEASEEERPYIDVNETISSDITAKNSSFFIANELHDSSTIGAPVFMVGNSLKTEGKYEYGFLAGNGVTIEGEYDRDLFAVANSLILNQDTKVGRDIFVAGNTITISDMHISGDAFVAANKLVLKNVTIDGNLNLAARVLSVSGETSIAGTVKYNGNLEIDGNLQAGQKETYEVIKFSIHPIFATLFGLAAKLVWLLVITLVFKRAFVRLLDRIHDNNSNDMTKTVLIGLAVFIGVPIAAVVLMLTIFGAPAGLALGAIYAVLVYSGSVATAVYINERLLRLKNGVIGATLGLVILAGLGMIPYVGGLISLAATMFGFSLIIGTLFGKE